jgi:hypothetical protein
MNAPKQSRHKSTAKKLEPIDWHEFANDAVLHGNMSTLYHRPPSEDPTAYASQEALVEIEKRAGRPPASAVVVDLERSDTKGTEPTVGTVPPVGTTREGPVSSVATEPTVGSTPGVPGGPTPTAGLAHTGSPVPTVGPKPPVGISPTLGPQKHRMVKPIRDVQDALTLAGQVLYKAMYGAPDAARAKSCTKGYRQLAAETHLDKDTVRDLIREFKDKGILRETGTYDADTRSSKTYEILSDKAILQIWRDAGLQFVTAGRQRPVFCTAQGEPLYFIPTVGVEPIDRRIPTVGPAARASGNP